MIATLCRMVNKHFSPLMISLVLLGVISNFVLYRQNSNLKAALQARTTEIALTQADNRNLANQLENGQIQLEAYQKQINDLNRNILAKMKASEQRTNDILNELEKHKTWADSAVPPSVSKLLNRNGTLSNRQAESTHLPEKSGVPNATNSH